MADGQLLMPRAGLTMESGQVLSWLVKPGDAVKAGDVVAELETDKTVMSLEAPRSGYVARILVPTGKSVPVGTVLAEFLDLDTPPPPAVPETQPPAPDVVVDAGEERFPAEHAAARGVSEARTPLVVRASPAAKRLAHGLGVSLANLRGSGPAGRVVIRDVRLAAGSGGPGLTHPEQGLPANGVVPLSRMRRAVAEAVTQSWGCIPQFQVRATADMTTVRRHLAILRDAFADAAATLTVTDFLVQAIGRSLAAHPDLHAEFVAGERPVLRYRPAVHVGMVVAVEGGLVVPVLHDADRAGLLALARERRAALASSRSGTLAASQYGDTGFSLSNLGPEGVEEFTALCLPGQTAVLATGAVADGPVAARFLHHLRRELEKASGWTLATMVKDPEEA